MAGDNSRSDGPLFAANCGFGARGRSYPGSGFHLESTAAQPIERQQLRDSMNGAANSHMRSPEEHKERPTPNQD